MKKFKELVKSYKDMIPYAVFGVLTTVVNVCAFWVFAHMLCVATMTSTVVAWMLAVLLAYLTNRKWVFHSDVSTGGEIFKEFVSFIACRLLTGFVDCVCMFVFVELVGFNDVLTKVGANALVIILNYIASKFVIFKKRGKKVDRPL